MITRSGRARCARPLRVIILLCEDGEFLFMLLQEKVAVITGGGRGIGREIALAYAREGAKLVLAARTVTELEETRQMIGAMGGEAVVIPTDIRDVHSVTALAQQTLAQFSRVDILVNN